MKLRSLAETKFFHSFSIGPSADSILVKSLLQSFILSSPSVELGHVYQGRFCRALSIKIAVMGIVSFVQSVSKDLDAILMIDRYTNQTSRSEVDVPKHFIITCLEVLKSEAGRPTSLSIRITAEYSMVLLSFE
jgi:hypothetical protein